MGIDGKQEVIKIGVSNSEVDKPFKKVQSGSETFSKLVESTANKDILVEKLLTMMQCSEKYVKMAI